MVDTLRSTLMKLVSELRIAAVGRLRRNFRFELALSDGTCARVGPGVARLRRSVGAPRRVTVGAHFAPPEY